MINYQFILRENKSYNTHNIERYIKVIEYLKTQDFSDQYTEIHHILPRSIWPEYISEDWNKIVISGRWHYILHWLLAKAIGNKMWFAFNQMRRIGKNSILYVYSRKYISNLISEVNSKRKRTPEEKQFLSEYSKGTLVMKDLENPERGYFRANLDDPNYLSGRYVYYRTGMKHSEETKNKISKNGIKRLNAYIDIDNKTIFLTKEEANKLGLKSGESDISRKNKSLAKKGKMWVNIKATKKDKLIHKDEFNENLHTKGRKNGPGWAIYNESKRKIKEQ